MDDNKEYEALFNEFPPVSKQEWETLIHEDLKGADYEKKLIWHTADGLKLKPYYTAEDVSNLKLTDALPGELPYVRGLRKTDNNWLIRQDIEDETPETANIKAIEALKKGAESLALNVSGCITLNEMVKLLKGIDLNNVSIHYYGASSYLQLAELLVLATKELGYDSTQLQGSFNFDSIGYFLSHGNFYASTDSNFIELSLLFDKAKRDFPKIKLININAHMVHNSGGTATQEVAYALAIGVEYLNSLTSKGQQIDDICERIQFTFATGSDYFPEIAKIRAARMLWAAIVQEYKPVYQQSAYMHIHSISSTWNKTLYDPYVNMLRTTTEAMSAAIGGCDSMSILPFDLAYKAGDKFSERVARNLQIILKEEAYFGKTADISSGSYYIENLTKDLAEAIWQKFLQTESKGGFIASANSGDLMLDIETVALKKQEDLATRRMTLLGTNQYPNYSEKMLSKIEPQRKASQLKAKKQIRLAQQFEALRLATEDYITKGFVPPKVFLLTIGHLAMRKARAGFALNFFACAGYEVVDNNGFKTPEEGVAAAIKSKADIVVICSSDEEYATIGVEIAQIIKKTDTSILIVVAGNPAESAEALKEAGVDTFIHVRTNVLKSLQEFNSKLGIN